MKWITAALPIAALALSCGGSDGNGRLTVMLTDAPGDFSAAVVTITEIDLVGGDGGKTVLSSTKVTTDLLTLSNKAASLVSNAVVKPGTYSELRFIITGGYVAVQGAAGTTPTIFASSPTYEGLPAGATVAGTLKMPSLAESGLKVDLTADALTVKADSKVLLIDFDVAQSFGHEAGNSGSWVMHPVIKGADLTLSGNVVVTAKLGTNVTLPTLPGGPVALSDFSAVLTNSGGSSKPLSLAPVAAGSTTFGATFMFLLPGSYTLTLQAPAGVTFTAMPAVPVTVTVGSGANTNEDFTITSAAGP
jgi:hypothetical protein